MNKSRYFLFIAFGVILLTVFCKSKALYYKSEDDMCFLPNNFNALKKSDMKDLNVYGEKLISCCSDPLTGFYRNGFCQTGSDDFGTHVVCARMTDAFLKYSKEQGNDLITAKAQFNFPGLKAGDNWCLCVSRWVEAMKAGIAPPIDLHASHRKTLDYVSLKVLETYSIANHN